MERGVNMRVFVGLEISDEARDELENTQNLIKPYIERGNLTKPDNLHLTLWFLGEVHDDLLMLVTHAVENISMHYGPFDLELGKLGAFQKKNRKILWAGVSSGEYHLEKLYSALEKEFKLIGIHADPRGLNPHITLGRQLNLLATVSELSERYKIHPVKFRVSCLTIFESKRVNDVLTYVPISRIELNK